MTISGNLADYSLPEVFQLLEQGHKTGLLTVCGHRQTAATESRECYIWFSQGRIVAAASHLDQHELLDLITRRGWLSDRVVSRLMSLCNIDMPMGLCLKSQGALQADQLKLLFFVQVMQQVCNLFKLESGLFRFERVEKLPMSEMTGLSKPAMELTLIGLRALRNWGELEAKLPAPTSALTNMQPGKPTLPLNGQEWQVWEFANGTISIAKIAETMQLPLEKVRQIAFRLIVTGVAEEMPMIQASSESASQEVSDEDTDSALSQSFLSNLVSFLRNKV